jgi:ABC-type multidrug transport system fused ATPase/permease subunit
VQKFLILLKNREKFFLLFIFLGAFVLSIVETLSLGSLAGFVMVISDPEMLISKLPNGDFKGYVSSLKINDFILYSSILLIVLFILKNIFILGFNYLSLLVERNILLNLSNRLLLSYLNQPYLFHVRNNPSKLINSIISETARGISFIFTSLNMIREILVLSLLFVSTIFINYQLSLIILATMGLASIIFFFLMKNVLASLGVKSKTYSEERLKNLSEIFGIIKIIKLYGASEYFQKMFNITNIRKIKAEQLNRFIGFIPRSFLEILAILTISFVTYYFIYNDYSIKNIIPILTLLAILLVRSIPAFGVLNVSASVLQYHKQSMINIVKEFEKYELIESQNKQKNISNNFVENIDIENLSFSYPNSQHDVLKNINLKISKSECIGLIGGSGSGKSTLIDIILGLYSPKQGMVLINKKADYSLHENYPDRIGYVPQDVYLTDDSIRNNIALGVNKNLIDDKKIFEIIKLLKLDQLILESEKGIDTIVGNRGIKLSGGQRQRIGIARAIYKDPQILILDEATNALDYESEKDILNSLIKNKQNKIIMIINHRVNMLKNCDRVLVVKNGMIIEKDKLDNLSKDNLN